MTQTKEHGWGIKQVNMREVVVEGVYKEIPEIIADILNPKSELGKIAKSPTIRVLKVRGFSLQTLRDEFAKKKRSPLEGIFPVLASFNVEQRHYVVEFSDHPHYKIGQVL